MNKNNTTKYFVYVRKSTEGEERQALSISSQMDKVKEFFSALDIVEVLEEKHSAFKPYNRPVFEDMIKRIRKGEASGIIAWHPDRLSRNEIDASTITYLVRTGVIKDLKFGSYSFDNSPEGIMMLQMSLSQSQYFSSKLGKDVRRGLEKKFEMGWQPNMAPNGYLNIMLKDKGYRIIKIDKKRFDSLRKAFDMMLTGNYSVPQVLNKLNDDWNFKTRIRKGGLTRSSLYRIFTNPFYAGIIEYNGKQKIGKHKAMITLAEYDRIQILLGKKGRPRIRKNVFAYSGLIRCANCGSLVSADKKTKFIKAEKKEKTYIYYRCNRKKPNIKCTEQAISETILEEQVNEMLDNYDVIPEFAQLYDEIVKDCKEESPKDQQRILENIRRKISKF
jgi:site-specific DNA recombinase